MNNKDLFRIIVQSAVLLGLLAVALHTLYKKASASTEDNSSGFEIVLDSETQAALDADGIRKPEDIKLEGDETENFTVETDEFSSIELNEALAETITNNGAFSETAFLDSYVPTCRTLSDEELIMMEENDMWSLLTGGRITDYPSINWVDALPMLQSLQRDYAVTIRVPIWYWKYPEDDTNFEKVKTYKQLTVNKVLVQIFQHVFEDILNDPSKPVINMADYGAGVWSIRGKSGSHGVSTHALGACIDINPSTGSFMIDGKWYGNGYTHGVVTGEMWNELPECHRKYHVLYDGSPIVNIFKSYGFVWGGDWTSTKDCMHLSFIGEGRGTRLKGQMYYQMSLEASE